MKKTVDKKQMTEREVYDLVENCNTRFKKGMTRNEIETLLKKIPSVSQGRLFKAIGVVTCLVIKGEVVYYRHDVASAIVRCIEKRDMSVSEFD